MMQLMILLSLLQSCKGEKDGLTRLSEASFLVKGFNWKDTTRVLVKHKSSNFHKTATEALKTTNDVADMSKAAATEALKASNDVADMLSKAAATEALKASNDVADMSKAVATEALKASNEVADMLSQAAATEKKNNREYLLKISRQYVSWDVKVFI